MKQTVPPKLLAGMLIGALLGLTGCKDDMENPLLGTWQDPALTTYEFRAGEVVQRPLRGEVTRTPAEYRIDGDLVTVDILHDQEERQQMTFHLKGKAEACLGPRPWSECLERIN